jgi:hypothetical protein
VTRGAHALILHAPALADRLLARVRPQVIVDVEDHDVALRFDVGLVHVTTGHRQMQTGRALIAREGSQYTTHPRRRWRAVRSYQRTPARRHQSAHSLDTSLPERERAGKGVERDAKRTTHLGVGAALTGGVVQAYAVEHCKQQPRTHLLHPLRRPHRLRAQRRRHSLLLGRCVVRARLHHGHVHGNVHGLSLGDAWRVQDRLRGRFACRVFGDRAWALSCVPFLLHPPQRGPRNPPADL